MQKLSMKSVNLTQKNIEKIAELFPNVVTETRDENGMLKRAIDFELLKQELSEHLVEGDKERYQLTWPGKKQAILTANTPINKTLRPVKEDSVDWDTTQNLYIEGDNLEVLKLLQESYLNKIKCIYIDPPYNTGKDFIYKDNFHEPIGEYLEESGQVDENGNRLFQNTESNGRFHSDWLTMMYPRLKIARNLLREDGVIFISIDHNEFENLKKICDEIFGSANYVETIIWCKNSTKNDSKDFATTHEYILCFAKNKNYRRYNGLTFREKKDGYEQVQSLLLKWNNEKPSIEEAQDELRQLYRNNKNFKGISQYKYVEIRDGIYKVYRKDNASWPQGEGPKYEIIHPVTKKPCRIPERGWRWKYETMLELLENDLICFGEDESTIPQFKRFLDTMETNVVKSVYVNNNNGDVDIRAIFNATVLEHPKPVSMIYDLIAWSTNSNDIILDFFSGSATTAHAVMQLNAEDGGNRRYIMVQLPEPTEENSEAYKAGFKNICEIGKERIRRAAKKIKEETGADIDYGFRVFRVDSSNMKDVYYAPDELNQQNVMTLESNIKEDRTGEDLLIQVMLELGLELSLPMETKQIEGKTVHYVGGNSLVACFDENVPEDAIKKIAQEKPWYAVFCDRAFIDDAARINMEELFKMLSSDTVIRVL